MMGELQIEAAAVDVERRSQQTHTHRRALDVPTRPAGPPGAVPLRLAGLGSFPESEVARVALPLAYLDTGTCFQFLGIRMAELAVVGIAADVKIDVAVRRIGKALVDQPPDHANDVGDILGRTWQVIDARHPEALQVRTIV